MSGFLAGKVWQSNLSGKLKPLAACLADIANDDGTSIYPSVEYLTWLMGKSDRAIQYGLEALVDCLVLEVVAHEKGGRGSPREYRMLEENFPTRPSWRGVSKKGAIFSGKGAKTRNSPYNDPSVERGALSQAKKTAKTLCPVKVPSGSMHAWAEGAGFASEQADEWTKLWYHRRRANSVYHTEAEWLEDWQAWMLSCRANEKRGGKKTSGDRHMNKDQRG